MRAAQVSVALLVLAACGADSASSELSVDVRIRHSRFTPDALTFATGPSVTFIVHNTAPTPAGETRTTTYTFITPGKLLIGCHLPTPWDYGMRGSIEVGSG